MKPNVIAIVGKSGSGKDSLAQQIVTNDDRFSLVVTATTRPKRDYEINGIDYIFMTKEKFDKTEKIEETSFNGWHYGTPLSSLSNEKYNIIVVNPKGFISLYRNPKINLIKGFELQVNDKIRLLRQLNREENPNIDEIVRRYSTDRYDFQEFDYAKSFLSLKVDILKNETLDDLQTNCNIIKGLIN